MMHLEKARRRRRRQQQQQQCHLQQHVVPTTKGQAAVTLLHDSQVKFPYHVPMGDREAPPDWGTIAVCEHAAINKLTNCNIIYMYTCKHVVKK